MLTSHIPKSVQVNVIWQCDEDILTRLACAARW